MSNAFIPEPGTRIPVALPDELVRGTVQEVLEDPNELMVLIDTEPFFAKHHGIRAGSVIKARRATDTLAGNRWTLVR